MCVREREYVCLCIFIYVGVGFVICNVMNESVLQCLDNDVLWLMWKHLNIHNDYPDLIQLDSHNVSLTDVKIKKKKSPDIAELSLSDFLHWKILILTFLLKCLYELSKAKKSNIQIVKDEKKKNSKIYFENRQ